MGKRPGGSDGDGCHGAPNTHGHRSAKNSKGRPQFGSGDGRHCAPNTHDCRIKSSDDSHEKQASQRRHADTRIKSSEDLYEEQASQTRHYCIRVSQSDRPYVLEDEKEYKRAAKDCDIRLKYAGSTSQTCYGRNNKTRIKSSDDSYEKQASERRHTDTRIKNSEDLYEEQTSQTRHDGTRVSQSDRPYVLEDEKEYKRAAKDCDIRLKYAGSMSQTCYGRNNKRRRTFSGSFSEKEESRETHNNTRTCYCKVGLDIRYFEQPFVCTKCYGDNAESLAEYRKRKSVVLAYVPPGDRNEDIFLDATNETRLILRGGARALGLVHRSSKSFGGSFELSDLFLDRRMCLKFDSRLIDVLQKSNKELEEADCANFALILTRDFFGGQAIPVDISRWLALLEDRPCQSDYLREYNICLMEPLQAAGHFMWLYQNLEVLRKEKPRIYWYIIRALTARHPSWKVYLLETDAKTVDLNDYVKEISEYNDKTEETPEFEDDARGALRLCMNVFKHVLSRSVVFECDRKGRRRAVRKFSDRHILPIVISVFGGLLVDFQELIFRVGYLEQFQLEEH